MKIVFMGTPMFSVPSLNELFKAGHELIVITQPDREKDKSGNLLNTPVKARALELGLKCYQFEKVSSQGLEVLKDFAPDLMVTAAYGQLLSVAVLDIARYGIFNVHSSLLPKYRGSSPIQSALINGETETGVTIMKTEQGMDTGDILNVEKVTIQPQDNAITLLDSLANIGATLLIKTISALQNNNLHSVKQDDSLATYCKKIFKNDGLINWSDTATNINNKIRAFIDYPVAYAMHNGKNLKIYSAEVFVNNSPEVAGKVFQADKNSLIISCGKDFLSVKTIQAPGKKKLSITEFMRGYKITAGEFLQ